MLRSIGVFLVAIILGGAGGMLGSIVGHSAGKKGIVAGGVIGGLLASVAIAAVARAFRWIAPSRFWATAAGSAIGFVCAAAIATNTLSSPVGPILSTLLIGVGAVLGAGQRNIP